MSPELNLTVSPDQFSIDGIPPTVEPRVFDGKDPVLPKIIFNNLNTNLPTPEQSAIVSNFCFNGTALLTPKAFDSRCKNLSIDTVDRSKLSGKLLILDLEPGIRYGIYEIRHLLEIQGIKLEHRSVPEYIVLFRTKLMNQVLGTTNKNGVPDDSKLDETQKNRPGITPEGARFLRQLGLAKTFMIDNISFEVPGQKGFYATQLLANPNTETSNFTPLVYHVGNTENDRFAKDHQGKNARIEIGNPPKKELPGYPVGVFVE